MASAAELTGDKILAGYKEMIAGLKNIESMKKMMAANEKAQAEPSKTASVPQPSKTPNISDLPFFSDGRLHLRRQATSSASSRAWYPPPTTPSASSPPSTAVTSTIGPLRLASTLCKIFALYILSVELENLTEDLLDIQVYSLIGGFCGSPVNFHAKDGSGHKFLGDVVLQLDKINPQVASRMVSAVSRWRRYDETRQALAKAQLEMIISANGLSENVYTSKSLAD